MLIYIIGALVGWLIIRSIFDILRKPRIMLSIFPRLNWPVWYPRLLAANKFLENSIRVLEEMAPYLFASGYSVLAFFLRRYCEGRNQFKIWTYEIPAKYVHLGLPFFVSPASVTLKYGLLLVGGLSKLLGSTKSYMHYHRFYWRITGNRYTNAILTALDVLMVYFIALTQELSRPRLGRQCMCSHQTPNEGTELMDEKIPDEEYDETYIDDETYFEHEEYDDEHSFIDDSEYWEDENDTEYFVTEMPVTEEMHNTEVNTEITLGLEIPT